MIPVFIAMLLTWLLGLCVVTVLLRGDGEAGLLERLCFAYPLGSGLISFQLFYLGLLRIPLTQTYATIPVIVEIITLGIWLRTKDIALFPKPSAGLIQEIASPKTPLLKRTALGVLAVWVAVKLCSVFVETYLRPIYAWDAWAHWSIAAKEFYYAHNLMLDLPEAEFFGRGVASRYISNPLHNPLSQVWLALWAGSFDEVLVKLNSPVYLLCTAVYLYRVACREAGRLAALGITVIFISSPFMSYHAIEVYSDFPLGVFIFFATAAFLSAMRGLHGFWPLAGMFSAFALFTKNEAPGMIIPLFISAVLYIWMKRTRISASRSLIALIAPLALIVPWMVFKQVKALSLIHDDQKFALLYQPQVVSQFLKEVLTLQNFNVFLILLPLLIVVKVRLSKEILHLLVPVVCYAAFFVIVFSFIPGYYQWAFNSVQFYRNTLTFYPAIALLTTLLLSALLKESNPVAVAPVKPQLHRKVSKKLARK
jgi:hypothetical protein